MDVSSRLIAYVDKMMVILVAWSTPGCLGSSPYFLFLGVPCFPVYRYFFY